MEPQDPYEMCIRDRDYEGHIVVEPKFDKVTIDEPLLAAYIKDIESFDK